MCHWFCFALKGASSGWCWNFFGWKKFLIHLAPAASDPMGMLDAQGGARLARQGGQVLRGDVQADFRSSLSNTTCLNSPRF